MELAILFKFRFEKNFNKIRLLDFQKVMIKYPFKNELYLG